MQVRIAFNIARKLRLQSAASDPHVTIPKLVNRVLEQWLRASATPRPPKRDAAPARRSLK